MIELDLIGYTPDLARLVLDFADGTGGRYRVVVDEDLFAMVDELRERRRAAGLPVGDLVEFADDLQVDAARLERIESDDTAAAVAAGRISAGHAAADDTRTPVGKGRWEDEDGGLIARLLDEHQATASRPEPAADPVSATAPESDPAPDPDPEPEREPGPGREPGPATQPSSPPATEAPHIEVPPRPGADHRQPPRPLDVRPASRHRPRAPDDTSSTAGEPRPTLSPAEIQAQLRHGKSVRSVAREAGVDEERIRRWQAPILAEQARVRERALAARLHRPRLGRSAQPLGDAVVQNLADRGVDPADTTWEVSRRRDGRWRVVVRYPSRGKKRAATWTYQPDDDTITPASDGARDLGFTRRR